MSNIDRIFDTNALSAREQVTDWYELKKTLGNRIAGTYMGYWIVPAKGKFRAQIGIALQDFDDKAKVVGVNLAEYFEDQVQLYRLGDEVGAEYYKDIPAKEAGMSDTKAVRLFNVTKMAREKAGEYTAPVKTADVAEDADPLKDFGKTDVKDDPGF